MLLLIDSETEKGKKYKVDTINLTCTCPDYIFKNHVCKHIITALDDLPERIQNVIDNVKKDNDKEFFIHKFGENMLDALIERGRISLDGDNVLILKND